MSRRPSRGWIARVFAIADAFDARAARRATARGPAAASRPFAVIAHRGASADAPENTIPAFRAALAQGATEVELDVQQSRDGEVFVFHDATLDAKTGARGALRDHDAASLRNLDVGSWFDARHPGASERFAGTGLATLAAVFDAFGARLRYQVELKAPDPELAERTLAVVARFDLRARVTLTSFHPGALERLRARDADVATCALIRTPRLLRSEAVAGASRGAARAPALLRSAVDAAARRGFGGVALPAAWLEPSLVEAARSRGLAVRAWRVRDESDLDQAVEAGAEAATVDWPARALAHLAGRRAEADA